MQTTMWMDQDGQGEFGDKARARVTAIPQVQPTADAELAECFVRAALAWAKWRERRAWQGR